MHLKIATKELVGVELGYAVRMAQGFIFIKGEDNIPKREALSTVDFVRHGWWMGNSEKGWLPLGAFYPDKLLISWPYAGRIIQEESISVLCTDSNSLNLFRWMAAYLDHHDDESQFTQQAHDPITAAMRCFVRAKLGDVVTFPPHLL